MSVVYNESFTYEEINAICLMCDFVNSIAAVPDFSTGSPEYDSELKKLAVTAVEIRNKLDEVVEYGK